jgi:diaminopimelate epimerase
MDSLHFSKYQGTGNDFILIDNRTSLFSIANCQQLVAEMCNRNFGIGADGLILLNHATDSQYDFDMQYFNADGNESTMCGNGGRCIVAFAHHIGVINETTKFWAIDGAHTAKINHNGIVDLGMKDVTHIHSVGEDKELNTGSPHFVRFIETDLDAIDVQSLGQGIRNSDPYAANNGINVNFFTKTELQKISLRTYERGVEAETLACGTGAVAAALVANQQFKFPSQIEVKVLGGNLVVGFYSLHQGAYTNIVLSGPSKFVFSGVWPRSND